MAHARNAIHRHRYSLTIAALPLCLLLALFSGVSAFCAVRCGHVQFWDGEMNHAVPAAHIFPYDWRTAADISVKMREGRLRAGVEILSDNQGPHQRAVAVPYEAEIWGKISLREAAAWRHFGLFLFFIGVSLAIFATQKGALGSASHFMTRRKGRPLHAGNSFDGHAAAQPQCNGQGARRSPEALHSGEAGEVFRPPALLSYGLPLSDQRARFYPADGVGFGPTNRTPVLYPESR